MHARPKLHRLISDSCSSPRRSRYLTAFSVPLGMHAVCFARVVAINSPEDLHLFDMTGLLSRGTFSSTCVGGWCVVKRGERPRVPRVSSTMNPADIRRSACCHAGAARIGCVWSALILGSGIRSSCGPTYPITKARQLLSYRRTPVDLRSTA